MEAAVSRAEGCTASLDERAEPRLRQAGVGGKQAAPVGGRGKGTAEGRAEGLPQAPGGCPSAGRPQEPPVLRLEISCRPVLEDLEGSLVSGGQEFWVPGQAVSWLTG